MSHFLYFFNLSNQITGIVEDRIDKKDRPIPSGKVTLSGAKIRWMIILSSYLAIATYEPSVLPETIAWVFTTAFVCLTSGGNHWFGKNNVAMTIATWAILGVSWKSMAPHSPESQIWVYGMAVRTGIMMHIQDIRDIKGDAASGRKTMSIAFGDWETRLLISFVLCPLSLFILNLSHILEVAPWTITMSQLIVAYRVLQMNGSRYDHKTYMYFTYFHCGILALLATEWIGWVQFLNRIALCWIQFVDVFPRRLEFQIMFETDY
ncbi:UbiA prenyltransferase family-domain-containing protein [Cyathus striatus]|nr:UbiA prenyltransferase family-domain-containing protein [Cyathus striatus]